CYHKSLLGGSRVPTLKSKHREPPCQHQPLAPVRGRCLISTFATMVEFTRLRCTASSTRGFLTRATFRLLQGSPKVTRRCRISNLAFRSITLDKRTSSPTR